MVEDLRVAIVEGYQSMHLVKILKGILNYCLEHFECEEMVYT